MKYYIRLTFYSLISTALEQINPLVHHEGTHIMLECSLSSTKIDYPNEKDGVLDRFQLSVGPSGVTNRTPDQTMAVTKKSGKI